MSTILMITENDMVFHVLRGYFRSEIFGFSLLEGYVTILVDRHA